MVLHYHFNYYLLYNALCFFTHILVLAPLCSDVYLHHVQGASVQQQYVSEEALCIAQQLINIGVV